MHTLTGETAIKGGNLNSHQQEDACMSQYAHQCRIYTGHQDQSCVDMEN